ncbi:hypothetical protein COLO4_00154 [Corchorus olitorius]|uniref:Uncharacterized protein n=1 Tax=Corchorus olitorius TaxID=93759 RepID=A0A1R3L4J2_9ROSI|nr:hypothetical protein COLO4_00154 [Corchorus olitorius]
MNGLQPLSPDLADEANHGDGFIGTYKAWKDNNIGGIFLLHFVAYMLEQSSWEFNAREWITDSHPKLEDCRACFIAVAIGEHDCAQSSASSLKDASFYMPFAIL